MKQADRHALIAAMLHWLVRHQHEQPGLGDLSARFGLSPHHLQRVFQQFAGVTPKQFVKYLTKEAALERLREGRSVLEASLDAGLSGPGRLHDLLVTTEAVTPGEARTPGDRLEIEYGMAMTPFGEGLVAWTPRGICFLAFCGAAGKDRALRELQGQWRGAKLRENSHQARAWLARVFDGADEAPLPVWLRGSPFQLRVWQALLRIPPGSHCSYGDLARMLGKQSAARAVGTAVGRNPVSWLIPCHRVITSLAGPGGYRWGIDIKLAMIGTEAARRTA